MVLAPLEGGRVDTELEAARRAGRGARQIAAPLKPRRLRSGDTVAVVAPSGPVPHTRLVEGIAALERLGLDVRLGAHVLDRTMYLAGRDRDRALDLVSLWARDDVAAVFCARGGYGAARIADALTPAFLRRHPKIFCGFSDITTLHAACARAGLVSFYGPMVAWDLAHGAEDPPRSKRAAVKLATATAISRSGGFDEDSLRAMLFEDGRGQVIGSPAVETIVRGRSTGRLVGGCLSVMVATLGTPEEVDTDGALLVLEDEKESCYRVDRLLTQLRRAGKLDRVRGLVLGDFPECHPEAGADFTLVDLLADRLGDLGVPVAWRFPIGHTLQPNVTLPLLARATLDAGRGTLTIEESPTVAGSRRTTLKAG
jgi:muramoyltetrapeptide carboxypeptidase